MYAVRWGIYEWSNEGDLVTKEIQRGKKEVHAFDLALAEFIKRQNNPRYDWVILVMDATK